jgi:regulatory protein
VRELRDKLARKGYPQKQAAMLIDDLLAIGLLDDAKYAQLWIESRAVFKPMGASRLRAELARKGITRELIDQALSDSREDRDEDGAALELARKKLRTMRSLEPDAARRRLAGFLGRRGYPGGVIAKVLKQLMNVRTVED